MNNTESIIGATVIGLVSYSHVERVAIIFDNNKTLLFIDCPMFMDSGIIGRKVIDIKFYNGEMGFTLTFNEMKISSSEDDYKYCYINTSDENPFTENRLRIAFKTFEIKNNNEMDT